MTKRIDAGSSLHTQVPFSVVTVYTEARSSRTEDQHDGFMFKDRANLFEVEFLISPSTLLFPFLAAVCISEFFLIIFLILILNDLMHNSGRTDFRPGRDVLAYVSLLQ
jgi:hypothetical protein